MSRVGKLPITIPDKTKITYKDRIFTVQTEKGTLTRPIHPLVDLKIEDGLLSVTITSDARNSSSMQGLTRALVSNMITGVTTGFERVLEVNGIGYRALLEGNTIVFNLGYSHPIHFDLPGGVTADIDKKNVIKLSGIDKELLGHTAAAIRRLRPPERYKGKGIKYAEEYIQRKAGKSGVKVA
ncbi:MAG: 50S ribosomal protein L6 [Deltaproteobacteria bacterium]|nr:50S ribosomal protein L6 [Deltaproteobacteria bacterium]